MTSSEHRAELTLALGPPRILARGVQSKTRFHFPLDLAGRLAVGGVLRHAGSQPALVSGGARGQLTLAFAVAAIACAREAAGVSLPRPGGRHPVRLCVQVIQADRRAFEADVNARNWRAAILNLNGLNMFEMLRAIEALSPTRLGELWSERLPFVNMVNMPRISFARDVVVSRTLPGTAVGDLERTGQVADAANFIAEKLAPVARVANPNPNATISSILLECNRYGIGDKSHIAYVLASAHHESGMGRAMTELADGSAYERRTDLGNTQPGDGPRFKGRGFVQITGRGNYARYTAVLRRTRGMTVDLVANPQRAADPSIAAMILAHGMSNGAFTGRRLSDFGRDCAYDFIQARRIVNGLDRAQSIAAIARRYRASLL